MLMGGLDGDTVGRKSGRRRDNQAGLTMPHFTATDMHFTAIELFQNFVPVILKRTYLSNDLRLYSL